MACKLIFTIVAVFVALPAISVATEHVVGGDRGWTMDFDYNSWADGRRFYVGDKLVFNYLKGDHNVYEADESEFNNCVPPAGSMPLASGNDVVTLATAGKKWYICGIPSHCSVARQKLEITVLDQSSSPASPPSTVSSAAGMVVTGFRVVLVVVIMMIVVV